MKNINLNFNGKEILATPDSNGMYNVSNIAIAYELPPPGQWRNSQRVSLNNSGNLVNKAGRYGGTWATEAGLYAYAMWADTTYSFYLTVVRAFTAAVNGDGDGAVEIASEVVQVREGLRKGNEDLCNTMVDHYAVIQTKANEYSQYAASVHRMVHKLATNKRMSQSVRSPRDELVKAGDAVALTRMTTLYGMYSALAEDGYEYQRIKAKLEAYVDKKGWFERRIS